MPESQKKKPALSKAGELSFLTISSQDFAIIEDLLKLIFPDSHKKISPQDTFIIAKLGQTPVGFSHIQPGKKSVCIRGLGVLPAYRKQGIASKLLLLTIKLCSENYSGMPIVLAVKPHNSEALKLYLKHGFILQKNLGGAYKLKLSLPT